VSSDVDALEAAAELLGIQVTGRFPITHWATEIAGTVDGHGVKSIDLDRGDETVGPCLVVVQCPVLPKLAFKQGVVRPVRTPARKKWHRRGRLLPRPDGLYVHLMGDHDEIDLWLSQIRRDGLMHAPEGTTLRPDGSLSLKIWEQPFTADAIVSRALALIDTCRRLGG